MICRTQDLRRRPEGRGNFGGSISRHRERCPTSRQRESKPLAEVALPDSVVVGVDRAVAIAVCAFERGNAVAQRAAPNRVVAGVDAAIAVVVTGCEVGYALGLIRTEVDVNDTVTGPVDHAAVGVAALIEALGRTGDQRPTIERRAARQEGVGERRSAVVGERS